MAQRPILYASRDEPRHVTWLELFFDLVFVLAIAELAHHLHDHLTVTGFLEFVFLFLPVWLVWSNYTYYADVFDIDESPRFRIAMLTAMLLSVALAVTIPEALGTGSTEFAVVYIALRALLVGLYVWAWRNPTEVRPAVGWHIAGFSAGVAIWTASLLAPEPIRFWMWGLGLLIEFATPPLAQVFALGKGPVQASHLSERFGLFTIVVLGESIVVTGVGVRDSEWAPSSVVVAFLGFCVVGCLWWLYFDRVIDESEIERAFMSGIGRLVVGFAWVYGHLVLYVALAVTAVGIELAIGEATGARMERGPLIAVCGGIGLSLLAITAVQSLSRLALRPRVLIARVAVGAFLLLLTSADGVLSPPVIMSLPALALVGLTVFEVGAASGTAASAGDRSMSALPIETRGEP